MSPGIVHRDRVSVNGRVDAFATHSVSPAAVLRTSAIGSCRVDLVRRSTRGLMLTAQVDFQDPTAQMHDFWLCLASHGRWGGTLPEVMFTFVQQLGPR